MPIYYVNENDDIYYTARILLTANENQPCDIETQRVSDKNYLYLIKKNAPKIKGVPVEKSLEFSCIQCLQTAVELKCSSVCVSIGDLPFGINIERALQSFLDANSLSIYFENSPLMLRTSYKWESRKWDTICACSAPRFKRLSPIEELLSKIDDTFAVTLLKLIDLKGLTDVECYKKANVSKQTWYKILNDGNYTPSKNTVLSFAIALELSIEETNHLLKTVGFTLSKSITFDLIVEYFIKNKVYDIMLINETLYKFDQPCLGYRER